MKYFYSMLLAVFLCACGNSANKENTQDTTKKADTAQVKSADTTNKVDSTNATDNNDTPVSQLDSVKKMIVNEWKVQAVLAPGKENNVMDEQQKEKMKNSSIVFKADGSQSMNVELKKEKISEEGRWKLAKDGEEVVMISPDGKERVFKIEEITKATLKLRAVIDEAGIVLRAKDAPPIGPLKKK